MKAMIFFIFFYFMTPVLKAQNASWMKGFGSTANDSPKTFITDSLGNSYITFLYNDSAYFNGYLIPAGKCCMAKFNILGNIIWTKNHDVPSLDKVIFDNSGHLLYFGGCTSNLVIGNDTVFGSYMVESDTSGNWIQAVDLPDCYTPVQVRDAHMNANNESYLCGYSNGPFGDYYGWVTIKDSSGTWQNIHCYSYYPGTIIGDVHIDKSSNVYSTGLRVANNFSFSKRTFSGSLLKTFPYSGLMDFDSYDNYCLVGTFKDSLNINGTVIHAIDTMIPDKFISNFDMNDSLYSLNDFGGQGLGLTFSKKMPNGHVLLSGTISSSSAIGTTLPGIILNPQSTDVDCFLALIDSLGNAQWGLVGGSVNRDYIWNVQFTQQKIFVSGMYNSKQAVVSPATTFSFGGKTIIGYGGSDIFIGAIDYPITATLNPPSLKSDFSVSPNPTHDDLLVTYELQTNSYKKLTLLNSQGQFLQSIQINEISGAGKTVISLKSERQGFYILKLETGNEILTRKFIKL